MAKRTKKQDDRLPNIPSNRDRWESTLKNNRARAKGIKALEERVKVLEDYLLQTTRGQATDFKQFKKGNGK